jgi:hypothetical protein
MRQVQYLDSWSHFTGTGQSPPTRKAARTAMRMLAFPAVLDFRRARVIPPGA